MKKYLFILLIMNSIISCAQLPKILIITTGGTIAGKGTSSVSETYEPGKVPGKELINSIPIIKDVADIVVKQPFNIGSESMLPENWITLDKLINNEAETGLYNGIVITHGTDTLEETAYFLNLTLKTEIPVVLTGAMRPSTSISADGPANLYEAVITACSKEAIGKGVLVVFNGKIFSAREVAKTNTINLDAFNAPVAGPLAIINMQKIYWNNISLKKHTNDTPFKIEKGVSNLPKVYIIYEYSGHSSKDLFKAAIDNDAKGIVLAGFGDGSVPNYFDSLIETAVKKGIIIVRSSRTGSGPVLYNSSNNLDKNYGVIPGNDLNPQKARILLVLSLLVTENANQIRKYFELY